MKYYILYNPLAGNKTCEEKINVLKEKYGESAECIDLTGMTDYKAFFSALDKEDVIILAGGDGTINHFVNDTVDIEIENDVLYYAAGTGNDFLRDIEVTDTTEPFSIKKYITNLPTVTVNGKTHRFINGVGYGIDGYCCEVGDKLRASDSDKPINYTAIAIKGVLFHHKPANATVTVDGVKREFKKPSR